MPVDVCGLEVEGGVEQLFQPAGDVVLLVVRHRLLLQLLQAPGDPTAAAAAFFPHGRTLRAPAGVSPRGPASVLWSLGNATRFPTPRSREASCPQCKELFAFHRYPVRTYFLCASFSVLSQPHLSVFLPDLRSI